MLISEVVKELGISKDEFKKVYKQAIGEELKPRTSKISAEKYEKIKNFFEKSGNETEKKADKAVKKIKKKVMKIDEIGGDNFLSSLGFSDEDTKDVDEIQVELKKEEEQLLGVDEGKKVKITSDTDEFFRTKRKTFSKPFKERREKRDKFHKKRFEDKKFENKESYQNHKKSEENKFTHKGDKRKGNVEFTHKKEQKIEDKKNIIQAKKEETKEVHKPKEKKISTTLKKKDVIEMGDSITVKEFVEKCGIPLVEVMKVFLKNKMLLNVNSVLDYETAVLVGEELGITVKKSSESLKVEKILEGDLQTILELDKDAENLVKRPPIVTVMGHVDHGKTTLLDYIRKTSVAEGEAGGITQSIGASEVEFNGEKIVFIDTPGHELFTNLRARGAKLTDIAVIVIAADDGIMPQTVESINHAKEAEVPIIIAVTKVDKVPDPKQALEKIKGDIGKYGLIPDDWGGDVPVIPVSGKTGYGVDLLLDTILLQAEILELRYNPDRPGVGVVLDSYKDSKKGIITSIIVMTGKLRLKDIIVVYDQYGKVRRMWNWLQQDVLEASGGQAVQILGLDELPEAGRIVEVVSSEKEAHDKIQKIKEFEAKNKVNAIDNFLIQLSSAGNEGDITAELKLIIKSDGLTGLEAMKQAISRIEVPENVVLKIIHYDIGEFSDGDLALAQASKALLIGFNVKVPSRIKKKAENLGVEVKNFEIIYEMTDFLQDLVKGMYKKKVVEEQIGKLEVLGIFYKKGNEMIFGGKVIEGQIVPEAYFKIYRDGEEIGKGKILSLKQGIDEVKEVNKGDECGIKAEVSTKIHEKDIIEFFVKKEV